MGLVTMAPSGTRTSVYAPITAQGITTGGKTGTAQKEVPEYDPKTGEMKTEKRFERDRRGNIIREYKVPIISPEKRIDSWFLCIAPLDYPQLAIAVIIEGGGYGARAAAPVAAALVLKARDLGLLGNTQAQPNAQQQQPRAGQQPTPRAQTQQRTALQGQQPAQTATPRPQRTQPTQPRANATPRAAPTRS